MTEVVDEGKIHCKNNKSSITYIRMKKQKKKLRSAQVDKLLEERYYVYQYYGIKWE